MPKGSVKKKGCKDPGDLCSAPTEAERRQKWYYRYYVEDASGNKVQKALEETQLLFDKFMQDYFG